MPLASLTSPTFEIDKLTNSRIIQTSLLGNHPYSIMKRYFPIFLFLSNLVIEEIFAIPGIGQFFVSGVMNRDVFLVSGVVLIYCVLLLFFNLVTDWLTAILDPRIRVQS